MFNFKFFKVLLPILFLTSSFNLNYIFAEPADKHNEKTVEPVVAQNKNSVEQEILTKLAELNKQIKELETLKKTPAPVAKAVKGKLASIFSSIKDTYGFIINTCDKMTNKKFVISLFVIAGPIVYLYCKFLKTKMIENYKDKLDAFSGEKIVEKVFETAGSGAVIAGESFVKGMATGVAKVATQNPMETAKIVGIGVGVGVTSSLVTGTLSEIGKEGGKKIAAFLGRQLIKVSGKGTAIFTTAGLFIYRAFINRLAIAPSRFEF